MAMQTRNTLVTTIVFTTLLLTIMSSKIEAKDNNLHFDGELVEEPCVLSPDTKDITLDFGTIADKYLYLNTRTHSLPFTIKLEECDTSISNSAVITFNGKESNELPGLLALTQGPASGIAIGLETKYGEPLLLNKATPSTVLQNGISLLTFQGYVTGEPTAINNKKIGRGTFSAVATFEIAYP